MKQLLSFLLLACLPYCIQAQTFDELFENKTLRVDYLFSGNTTNQSIYLDELSTLPTWSGRRNRFTELPLEGNGQIIVKDAQSKKPIYTTSFSTLFQEWLTTDEAQSTNKAFENTFLLPYPKQPIEVEVVLFSSERRPVASMTHTVDPKDILIHQRGTNHVNPYRYILKSGDEKDCIDVAILAEGYTEDEMELFYEDAEEACENIFSHSPFKTMKEKFNVVAVASPSVDSGVSVPRQNDWKKTAVSSHFDTFYSDRYLTTSRVKAIHNALAGIPYEHIIILANTDVYGGGGIYNAYTLTTAHHEMFGPVVVHEFGHSFGGLADEYFYETSDALDNMYPLTVEPWEQNITTQIDFESKWKKMLPTNTPIPTSVEDKDKYPIGVYEGGGYQSKGIDRPAFTCRMRNNEATDFCRVCQKALQERILLYT